MLKQRISFSAKLPLHVETLDEKLVYNGAAKQVSAGVALCNMVGFVKLFRTSVARQVSRKVEPLSTSSTTRNGRSGEKTEFHRVTPLRETCFAAPLHRSFS